MVDELTLNNGEDELILWIYLDRSPDGHYGGEIKEANYGSNSGTYGETIAEAVTNALKWAGVEGFNISSTATLDEIREALSAAASKASFDFDVRLYTSF